MQQNAIVKVKHFIAIILALNMSKSSVIDSEFESVWFYIRYMLKLCSFVLKTRLKYFFLCKFSAILIKLTDFYYFLIALRFVCSYFGLKRCF